MANLNKMYDLFTYLELLFSVYLKKYFFYVILTVFFPILLLLATEDQIHFLLQ